MSTPSKSMVHIDRPLSNISIAYSQSADAFAAARVFPVVPVAKQSDKYWVYLRAAFLRDEMRKRAPGTESAGGGWQMTTDSYSCDVWAFHKDLDNQTLANYDEPLNARRETTEYLTQKFLISREKNWVTNFFGTGIWTREKTGAASGATGNQFNQWDAPSTADPIKDVSTWKLQMLKETGYKPNVMTVGAQVWEALKQSPDILDRVKFQSSANGQPSLVSRQTIAALFEVDEIIVSEAIASAVGEAVPDVANTAAAVASDFIAGKHLLLSYRPRTPGLLTPSAGYTFEWTGLEGGGGYNSAISSFYLAEIKSERIEIEAAYASKQVCNDLGTFALNVIA